MGKRRKWILIGLVLAVGLALAGVYEYATHVGRGWLRGEAFFEGRPTSYWRLRCDQWLERFKDDDSVVHFTWLMSIEMPGQEGACRLGIPEDLDIKGGSMEQPRETYWKRMRDALHSKAELERERFHDFAPEILWGMPESVPVFEEMAADEKYRLLAKLAIRRVEYISNLKARLEKEASN